MKRLMILMFEPEIDPWNVGLPVLPKPNEQKIDNPMHEIDEKREFLLA